MNRSFDFGSYADSESFNEQIDLGSQKELYLLYGSYLRTSGSNEKTLFIYLNFLKDKGSIRGKDLYLLLVSTTKDDFFVTLSSYEQIVDRYDMMNRNLIKTVLKELQKKSCPKTKRAGNVELVLNGQNSSLDLKGSFDMTLVNKIDMKSKKTANSSANPSFKCSDNDLVISYLGQRVLI